MLYSDFTTALGVLLQYPITNPASATPSSNTDFNNILPRIIESAEQRIYREMDFLYTRVVDASVSLTVANRNATLPSSIIVVQSVNLVIATGGGSYVAEDGITPYVAEDGSTPYIPETSTSPTFTRIPLEITSKDFIDSIWPIESTIDQPQYLAFVTNSSIILAPTPDQAYTLEVTGIFRPSPLSASNPMTYLTLVYPDLFLYAAMIFAAGFQRDFGAQSEDPKMAMSWQAMYDSVKGSVNEEDQRGKYQDTNWSPYSKTPLSTPRP